MILNRRRVAKLKLFLIWQRKKREAIPSLTYDEALITTAWQMAWDNCLFQRMREYKKR